MIVTSKSLIALFSSSLLVLSLVLPSVSTTKAFSSPGLYPFASVNMLPFAFFSAKSRRVGDLSLVMLPFMRLITWFTDQELLSLNLLWSVACPSNVSRDTRVLSSEISNFWTKWASASFRTLRTVTSGLPLWRLFVVSTTRPRFGLQTRKKHQQCFEVNKRFVVLKSATFSVKYLW